MSAARTRCVAIAWTASAAISVAPAQAYEFGAQAAQIQPGVILGNSSAGAPPPGLYGFNQVFGYKAHVVGPGAPKTPGGGETPLALTVGAAGLLWVPGWTFLGATYDAVIVQPYGTGSVGAPANSMRDGFHNTYLVPGELSWKLGDSGFFVKTGLGISIPDGTITGPTGLGNIGNPWWSFIPQLSISYLKDGWNLSAIAIYETNTKNTMTDYKSGDVLHLNLIATKQIDKWTLGPIGYYVGQVTDDTSSAFYHNAINTNRYNVFAAGGLVGYNFGAAQMNVWAVSEFSANASGVAPGTGSITKGFKVFGSISYRLWAPDPPAAQAPQFRK